MPAESTSEQTTAGAQTISDIGQDEAYIHNLKRTVEEYQNESLESIRQNRALALRIQQNAISDDAELRSLSRQALQNAVETANMVGKQSVRHSDIAIDRQWNVDEQGQMATIGAAVLSDMAKRTFGTTETSELMRAIATAVVAEMAKQNQG